MDKKRFIIALILSGVCAVATAQTIHEISVYGAGGLSSLSYQTTFGKSSGQFGGQFGAGYTFYFSKHFGIGSGLEVALYNKKFQLSDFSDAYMATDMDGEAFEFRYRVDGYTESQQATYLNIPLLLRFRSVKSRIYASLGAKAGFNVGGRHLADGQLDASGYYEFENKEYTDLYFMGFGHYDIQEDTQNRIRLKPSVSLSAEIGTKWRLSLLGMKTYLSLYTGLFFDYGLNKQTPAEAASQPFVRYDINPSQPIYTTNSILMSQYNDDLGSHTLSQSVVPFAFGVKVALCIDTNGSYKDTKRPGWGIHPF